MKCPPPVQASGPLWPVLAPQGEGHMFSSSLLALETSKYPQECGPHLGKAGGQASELEWGSGSVATANAGEGRLRIPSRCPHGSPALASALRPRPRLIRENPDPFGTGSKGPTKAPARPQGPAFLLEEVLRRNPLPGSPHPKPAP